MSGFFGSNPHCKLQALKGVPQAVKPQLLTLECPLVERGIVRNNKGMQFHDHDFFYPCTGLKWCPHFTITSRAQV